MNTETIIKTLDTLTLAELKRIDAALHELLDRIKEWQQPPDPSQPLGARAAKGKTYRLEKVRCGKDTCKRCAEGPGHGPYWYCYWSEKGRTRKLYIGKEFREV